MALSLRSDPLSSYTKSRLCASAVYEYDRPTRMTVEERMSRVAGLIGLVAVASVALWPPPSPAQEPYPSRTVKIVVPAVAGSTTDALARIVADQLSQKWGRATIVENIPGGAMNIGALSVARAAPDGYTLLIAPPSPLSFNHLLYRDTGYEPSKFVPITMLAKIPNVLVVRKDIAAATLQELIDYGKANPGKLTYASQGVGSTAHLSAAQLEVQTGIKMVHVPYRGAQPALTDVVAGHVDMFFDTLATSVPLYRDNKVKLMGVADLKRAGVVPRFADHCAPVLIRRGREPAHLRVRRRQVSLIHDEGGFRRLHLRFRNGHMILVELRGAIELRARQRELGLRGLRLRLGAVVVVAEFGQPRDVKDHAVGADFLLMRNRHQRVCFYAAALLGLVVNCDDGCAVLGGYPQWRLDRMTAVGFNHRRVATDKQAPDQERSKGGSKDYTRQPSPASEQPCPLLSFIHLDSAVCLTAQCRPRSTQPTILRDALIS